MSGRREKKQRRDRREALKAIAAAFVSRGVPEEEACARALHLVAGVPIEEARALALNEMHAQGQPALRKGRVEGLRRLLESAPRHVRESLTSHGETQPPPE